MKKFKEFPRPLLKRWLLTVLLGIAFFAIGLAITIYMDDRGMFVLSAILCLATVFKACLMFITMNEKNYEVVEGTCVSVSRTLVGRKKKIKIMDNDGNESLLLLGKNDIIKIGYIYRFYFKDTERLTVGNSYLDSALNADCFLGYEEIGVFEK